MGEEIRRIEEVKKAEQATEQSRSSNLTGEQLFVRSCNTCHPGGKQGMGPSLEIMDTKYASDAALIDLIRKGKGIMPGQGKSAVNDQEMNNLVVYLRRLNQDLKDSKK